MNHYQCDNRRRTLLLIQEPHLVYRKLIEFPLAPSSCSFNHRPRSNHIRKSHLSNVPLGIWGAVWSMPSGTGYTPDKPTTTGYSSSLIIFRIASRESLLLGKSCSRIIFSLFFSIFISILVFVAVVS